MTMPEQDLLASVTCSSTRHPGVGRFRRRHGSVELLGVSRQRPGSVLPPSSGPSVTGALSMADEYRGCPSCGADNIVRCGQCHQLGCWDSTWPEFACACCGNRGLVSGVIEEFTQFAGG